MHGPGIFPHLRAGAARRQLSSKPKPGKPGKVPKHPENFRESCARPSISFRIRRHRGRALRAASVELERTQGFKPLTLRLDQNPMNGVPAGGMCTDGPPLLVVSFVTQRHFSRTFVDCAAERRGRRASSSLPRRAFLGSGPRPDGLRRRGECHRIGGREGFNKSLVQHFIE